LRFAAPCSANRTQQAAPSCKLCEAVGGKGEVGGRSADVGVVMDGVDVAGRDVAPRVRGRGVCRQRRRCCGEDRTILDTATQARDVDGFSAGEPKVLRDVVGIVGDEKKIKC
jgi:hypothetical protein